jgi:hypothetical protein
MPKTGIRILMVAPDASVMDWEQSLAGFTDATSKEGFVALCT